MSRPDHPFGLSRDGFGRLVLSLESGAFLVGVSAVRAFPLTAPDELISLVDDSGREVASVERLSSLAPELAALLEDELARREFMPDIVDILEVSGGAEPTTWRVATERGETTFVVPAEEAVRALPPFGALVTDDHGIRYRIRDRRRLSRAGQRILDRYI